MGEVTKKTELNKSMDAKLKVQCSSCKGETNHIVIQSVDCDGSELFCDDENGQPECMIEWSDCYQIIKCQGCDRISFRHVSWFSEARDESTDGSTTFLYPKRSAVTRAIKDYYNAPNALRRIYRETIECFNNEAWTLCAAGLRAIIEGICADRKIADGPVEKVKPDGTTQITRRENLEGKIAELGEMRILSKANASVLHEHRFLGNEAVHQLTQPSPAELTLAIEIMEHTMDDLYDVPDKAAELRRMRLKK